MKLRALAWNTFASLLRNKLIMLICAVFLCVVLLMMSPLMAMKSAAGAQAAAAAGCNGFAPDACLINRYQPGARMSLHQDKDEKDFGAPIVSVSLGLPAVFLFGGLKRTDKPRRFRLEHDDVVVWGGPTRLVFHGVAPLADGEHLLMGRQRINLTFRKAR